MPTDWHERSTLLMGAVEQHKYAIEADPNDAAWADEELWNTHSELEAELWADGE